jgi:hypothetical protein
MGNGIRLNRVVFFFFLINGLTPVGLTQDTSHSAEKKGQVASPKHYSNLRALILG